MAGESFIPPLASNRSRQSYATGAGIVPYSRVIRMGFPVDFRGEECGFLPIPANKHTRNRINRITVFLTLQVSFVRSCRTVEDVQAPHPARCQRRFPLCNFWKRKLKNKKGLWQYPL